MEKDVPYKDVANWTLTLGLFSVPMFYFKPSVQYKLQTLLFPPCYLRIHLKRQQQVPGCQLHLPRQPEDAEGRCTAQKESGRIQAKRGRTPDCTSASFHNPFLIIQQFAFVLRRRVLSDHSVRIDGQHRYDTMRDIFTRTRERMTWKDSRTNLGAHPGGS